MGWLVVCGCYTHKRKGREHRRDGRARTPWILLPAPTHFRVARTLFPPCPLALAEHERSASHTHTHALLNPHMVTIGAAESTQSLT
jgi:hypothetical protein